MDGLSVLRIERICCRIELPYIGFILLKICALVSVLSLYDAQHDLLLFLYFNAVLETSEFLFFLLISILRRRQHPDSLRPLFRSGTVMYECVSFLTTVSIAIELIKNIGELNKPIGILAICLVGFGLTKAFVFSVFFLFLMVKYRRLLTRQNSRVLSNVPDLKRFSTVGESPGVCAICISDLAVESSQVKLDCSHVFHYECLEKWVRQRGICPICRQCIEVN